MTEVVLFHSVLGLNAGVTTFAERLRARGHAVHAPDLFDGVLLGDYDAGIRKLRALGDELTERAAAAAAAHAEPLVLAGFSAGAWLAEYLAGRRADALAAVLMHDAQPPAAVELDAWPGTVAVQVHGAEHDEWLDWDAVRALERSARAAGADVEVFAYPGAGHLFADPGLPEFAPDAAALMLERVGALLDRLDGAG